jgi:hypothetical protein
MPDLPIACTLGPAALRARREGLSPDAQLVKLFTELMLDRGNPCLN